MTLSVMVVILRGACDPKDLTRGGIFASQALLRRDDVGSE
jgi:hypothetical protein